MNRSNSSMAAHSLLRRLAIDVDERQLAGTIELTEDVWAGLEGVEDTLAVAQTFADEGHEMRRVVGLQEQVDRDPVAADVAARIVRHCHGAHFALRRHDHG